MEYLVFDQGVQCFFHCVQFDLDTAKYLHRNLQMSVIIFLDCCHDFGVFVHVPRHPQFVIKVLATC